MKRKFISAILSFCMIICALPMHPLAYVGDILPSDSVSVQTNTTAETLVLQNEYIRVTLNRQDGSLTTSPAATVDSANPIDRQKPYCEFVSWKGYGYSKQELVYPAALRLKNATFVDKTPNGDAKGIKVEYDLTAKLPNSTLTATTAVYYELVQYKEDESSEDAWGVLTTVNSIYITGGYVPPTTDSDAYTPRWGYTLDGFTGMGHANATDGPAIKMSRTVCNYDKHTETSESSVLTGGVENLSSWSSFFQGKDYCNVYIGEVYVDGYTWANPFVGLTQDYNENENTLKVVLPETVSVTPGSTPANTRVECKGDVGYHFNVNEPGGNLHFLWGFRDLKKGTEALPSEPDKVEISINAKRLAAFAGGNGGVTVEYIADDAALDALKKQYGDPVALISGDCESKNGTEFTFTDGAALLSPSVTATWNKTSGKLVIKKDGTIEHSGVSLNAPSFKFYQPNSRAGEDLKITLTKDGLTFEIDPERNDAIIYVDIPYATAKLEKATADTAGNLVFSGDISFQTIFEGASFALEELGYGLNEKKEFTVNGVHATGSFDTAKTLSLELAKVEGEVNTFKGKEKYAFSLELNVFDLFETEAELELVRSKKDGSLLPNTLYFYVAASPGIVLIPPVPVGQLNGGGAGFKDLADTVNGDYFAIPPLKLRGTLKGTYLHLIEGKGDVVIGPSEISLTASDVGIVGTNASIIDSFGYSIALEGQERKYQSVNYNGVSFVGSKHLGLALPSKNIDLITLNSEIKLGAFGGVNDAKDRVYLGIGANGTVAGRVQIPSNSPVLAGKGFTVGNINLIVGGQTTFQIRGVSVEEGMKQAFQNVDVYLGAVAEVGGWLASARAWVLVPQIVETNFRKGGGWDIEVKAFGYLPEWDWSEKGVEPIVQAMSLEDGGGDVPMLLAAEPFVLESGGVNTTEITVNTASQDETPYILLAFDNSITEQEIKDALKIEKNSQDININWVGEDGLIDSSYDINADTDIINNKTDNKDYRVALLRLKEGGTYLVNTGSLELEKHQETAVTPFEELDLNLNDNQVSGKIKYAEANTKYVLRTYFAETEGGADYMIDEQEISDTSNIDVPVPSSGALAPTGEYYFTAFLMTEKEADINGDGELEKALIAIDNQVFDTKVTYTNIHEPSAPTDVTLQTSGNEVMRAQWNAADDADGYAVRIYEEANGVWTDTGYGYDLDKDATAVDMALTVGGNGVSVSEDGSLAESVPAENLLPDRTYKIGVRAYKNFEGGKYYSKETESAGEFLPKYTPMEITLSVNGNVCTADENGVYHAYVGGDNNTLSVNASDNNAVFKVSRMDTNTEIAVGEAANIFEIPEFEGSLMFKVDGISGNDVTSVFLLVNMDKEPPVLTLSPDIFYADRETGDYMITGISHAGSKIIYGDNEEVIAGSDGRFSITGSLYENETSSFIMLYAQDFAANTSTPQAALVTRKMLNTVTVNGSYAQDSGSGEYTEGETVTIKAGERSGYRFSGWKADTDITFEDEKSAETTFTMPGKDVTVTASWTKSGGNSSTGNGTTRYTVSFDTNGGSRVASQIVTRNSVIKELTAPTKDGYKFDGWYTDKEFTKAYNFSTKITASFTLYAKWTKIEVDPTPTDKPDTSDWANPFTDVSESDWYYGNVKFVSKNGLMNGTSSNEFSPNKPLTRGMLVTVLYRAEGEPAVNNNIPFTDVTSDSYFANAVVWAEANGIVNGISENAFAPDENITREQIAAIMHRYAKYKGYDVSVGEDTNILSYTDAQSISEYAISAMQYAVGSGLMKGKSDTTLNPLDNATRAEIAAISQRFLEANQ